MNRIQSFCGVVVLVLGGAVVAAAAPPPLRVCTTVTDLGDLVKRVGGQAVEVTIFAQGVEDAHFVEAKPSFIKQLSRADVFVQMGMELELGWAGLLLQGARNSRVMPGAPGFIDASTAITPLAVPASVDRSMGDVHVAGNPHYLSDPENGRRVAKLLTERLSVLRPEQAADFEARFASFSAELDTRLGAWTAQMAPWRGRPYVADHDMWIYFADRFGLEAAGFLEPKPGMPPTTRHLEAVMNMMRERHVPIVIASPYYDPRHAAFVARNTGARVVPLAHQVGSRPGTADYMSMVDHNVRMMVEALEGNE